MPSLNVLEPLLLKASSFSSLGNFRRSQDLFPRACALSHEYGCSNALAWKRLLDELSLKRVSARTHPSDVLQQALQHYVAHGVSSSGVECAFSKSSWYITSRRNLASACTEEFLFKLTCDLPNCNLDDVLPLARHVWALCFGGTRLWKGRRFDKGVKRKLDATGQTESSFVRKRRAESNDASKATEVPERDVFERPNVPGWSPALDAELGFQRKKCAQRLALALGEGSLLPEEKTEQLETKLHEIQAQRVRDHRARRRKSHKDKLALQGAMPQTILEDVRGSAIHIDDSIAGAHRAQVQRRLQPAGLREVADRQDASVFVVSDLVKTSQRTRWQATVQGGYLLHETFLANQAGPVIKFKAVACAMPRTIYVSAEWRAHRPHVWQAFQGALSNLANSTWTLEDNLGAYLNFKRNMMQRNLSARALALVRDHEKETQDRFALPAATLMSEAVA